MTQNDEQKNHSEQKLCTKCQDMFGHVNFDYMCSLCYKKQKNLLTVVEMPKHVDPLEDQELPVLTKVETQISIFKRTLPKDEPKEQLPKGKCNKCSKKTGMLGFLCKHCSSQFCKFHRLPESHGCEVDYIAEGRKKIKTENPVIANKKIKDI